MEGDHGSRPTDWGAVVGGIVAGWILCWAGFAVVVLAFYSAFGDSASSVDDVLAWSSLVATPVAFLVTLLVRRRLGHVASGMLLGLTVGSIVAAGVCSTVLTRRG